MIVTVKHMRAAGVCRRARFWFEEQGLDWKDFVRNGIEADKLLATKNAQAAYVVEVAARGRQ